MPKKFYCTPLGVFVPLIFLGYALFFLYLILQELHAGRELVLSEWLGWSVGFGVPLIFSFVTARIMARYVLIYPDHIVCRGLFCRKIVLEYDKCYIGVDYANQKGSVNWWIYLSYAPYPPFKKTAYYNRINSRYCKQGFIRIMYNEDVYKALMDVLPKKQRTALGASYSLHIARYKD